MGDGGAAMIYTGSVIVIEVARFTVEIEYIPCALGEELDNIESTVKQSGACQYLLIYFLFI